MSHSLADVQSEFANALRYQNNGEHCDIVSDHFTDEQRIQIYRNNFVISLSEVLAATYPLTEMLVGEECFQQMARQHVLSYPSTSGDVSGYGEHFEQTIQTFPAVIELNHLSEHRLPYISVLTDQTYGGVSATISFYITLILRRLHWVLLAWNCSRACALNRIDLAQPSPAPSTSP